MSNILDMMMLNAGVGKEVILKTSGHDEEFLLLVMSTAIKRIGTVKDGIYDIQAVFSEIDEVMFEGTGRLAVKRNIDYFADCAIKPHSSVRFTAKLTSNISRLVLALIIKICRISKTRVCLAYARETFGIFSHNLWEGKEYDILLDLWSNQPQTD